MKAIAITAAKRAEVIDVPDPAMGPEDVLLAIQYVGLCGSDLNTYRGNFALASYPLVPGHEISGIVAGKGKDVPATIQAGDKVTIVPYTNCGVCPSCRVGRPNCCQFNQTLGVQRDGALSHRFAVHHADVFKSEILTPKELALVEPMSVGYHAANRGGVNETDTVLVIGCGTIGIGVIAACTRKGATVIAVDIDDDKLALAQAFGAQHVIHSTEEDVLKRVASLTDDEGVSIAIEAVGLPQTYRLAIDAVRYAGRVVYIGYAKTQVSFDTTDFVRKELDIRGSRNALFVFRAVIKMLEKREQPFAELITRVYPFDRAGQALADWDADPARFTKILIDLTM